MLWTVLHLRRARNSSIIRKIIFSNCSKVHLESFGHFSWPSSADSFLSCHGNSIHGRRPLTCCFNTAIDILCLWKQINFGSGAQKNPARQQEDSSLYSDYAELSLTVKRIIQTDRQCTERKHEAWCCRFKTMGGNM